MKTARCIPHETRQRTSECDSCIRHQIADSKKQAWQYTPIFVAGVCPSKLEKKS